jgi:hypothetical protein
MGLFQLKIIFQQENGFLALSFFERQYALLLERTAKALQKVVELGTNDAGNATMSTVSQLVNSDPEKVRLTSGKTLWAVNFEDAPALIVDWTTQTVTIGGEDSKKYSFADFIYVYAGDYPRTLDDLKEMSISYQKKVKAPTDENSNGRVRRWFYAWDGDGVFVRDFFTLEEAEHYAKYHEYEMFDLGLRVAPFTRVYNSYPRK